ncbi:MAG: class I tRNA ligase family protein [Acidobacteriota bacterium]
MHVQHLEADKLFQAYNVDLQMLYPWEGVVETPFGAAWAILAPGESTKLHQHQEGETFFIARGSGVMEVADESTPVTAGSVVFQQPFQAHTLTNTSGSEDLMFLTVWWQDRQLWPEHEEHSDSAASIRRVMVTAAPPTPNGDLHVGHLSGPYLAADAYNRYLRLRGVASFYACGTDDHCMYVERMGEQLDMTGHQAADHFTRKITKTLSAAAIRCDLFMKPDASARFEPLVLTLFDRLWRSGKLEAREGPSPYCELCERYLFEADITGLCPHCGDGVTGNTCESCAGVNDALDLVEARCTSCQSPPATRRYRRLFFPLSASADALRTYLRRTAMSPRLRAFCERQLAAGLPDIAISHVSGWGIPVPLDEPAYRDQTLYVWFEMAARYLAYADRLGADTAPGGDYRSFFSSDDANIVQFFGFDNSFYYALLLPALYMAFDDALQPPAAFVVNEFYRLDGEKFSTSRGHTIPGRELLASVPRDMARFYLASTAPEREQTNFTLAACEQALDTELTQGIRPWLRQLARKTHEELDGKVPATGDWTNEHLRFYRRLERLIAEATEAYEPTSFSLQRASRVVMELVRTAHRFGASESHWRGVAERQQERRTAIALELLAARVLAVLAAPLMPDFSARLWRDLGHDQPLPEGAWELSPAWLPEGQTVGELGEHDFLSVRARQTESPVSA